MATGGDDTVTISELEEYYHLPQGSLDRECTTDHALEIARALDSWEQLATRLKLTKQQIGAIKRDNDNEQGRREATLTKWKEAFAFKATYRKLATAFLAVERADLASLLCALIVPKQAPSPAPLIPNLTAQQDHLSVDQSPSPSPSSPQTSLEPTSPQSSSGISVGSPPQLLTFTSSHPITKNPIVKELESKFAAAVLKVIELYTQSNVPVHKLKRIVNNLTPDIKGELGPFFRKERSSIIQSKSIDELFAVLSDFWDYLQPDLLVYLVEQCDNNEAKMVVSEYEEELAKCRKQITLQEYIGKRQCNLDDDDRYQIAIRLGNEWHEKTLDDLEKMRFAFADEFSLLRLVPKLHGLKSNSITVIFSLPKSVFLNHDQLLKFFQPYNPLQVMADGVSIYDVESHEITDMENVAESTQGKSKVQGIMAIEKEKLRKKIHCPSTSSNVAKEVTKWEVKAQGKTHYGAYGSSDVLIIVSSESLQGPDIVPRRAVELTKEDIEKLQRLNLPPEQWKDDASIMKAKYEMDERKTVVGVERSTPEDGLTREYVLKRIERLMTSTRKQGVIVYFCGPGKRNTGDWCFEDGFITFRDLAQLYCKCFKGFSFTIGTDCSFSGSWVKELVKFLDEQGVRPCGHSAREKGMLIKVCTSCQSTEIPYRLLYSVRAVYNDKNTGMGISQFSGFEVAKDQHVNAVDPTALRCNAPSFEEPCTWESEVARGRIILLRGPIDDQQDWDYVLLADDEAKIREFKQVVKRVKTDTVFTVDIIKYGRIIESGWGKDPPDEIDTWIRKTITKTHS